MHTYRKGHLSADIPPFPLFQEIKSPLRNSRRGLVQTLSLIRASTSLSPASRMSIRAFQEYDLLEITDCQMNAVLSPNTVKNCSEPSNLLERNQSMLFFHHYSAQLGYCSGSVYPAVLSIQICLPLTSRSLFIRPFTLHEWEFWRELECSQFIYRTKLTGFLFW